MSQVKNYALAEAGKKFIALFFLQKSSSTFELLFQYPEKVRILLQYRSPSRYSDCDHPTGFRTTSFCSNDRPPECAFSANCVAKLLEKPGEELSGQIEWENFWSDCGVFVQTMRSGKLLMDFPSLKSWEMIFRLLSRSSL